MAKQSRDTKELERRLLAALCASSLALEDRTDILGTLAYHNWINPDHRVIYEALRRSRHRDSATLREHISAEITRLGFPDIEIEPFFAPCTLTEIEIAGLANALLAAGAELPNQK
jgi:hypothetical protein